MNLVSRYPRFFTLLLFFLSLISCYQSNGQSKSQKNVLSLMSLKYVLDSQNSGCTANNGGFWVRNLLVKSQTTYCINARLVASSVNMDLYLENSLATNLNYASVASAFETNIFPIEKDAYGAPSDVNGDKKVTVLILDIKEGATTTSGFIAGYVDPINFYADDPSSLIRSNQREILFMDGVELLRLRDKDLASGKPDTFLSTLAHEFQHLIRFQYTQTGSDDTWIDEGTSEVTSDLTGYGPQTARISCFKGDAASSSSCSGGIGSTSYSSPSLFNWTSSLKNYAYAYSFMKYVYESSGKTTATRNQFFQQTMQGLNGTRANNAYNLMTIFMSSGNYDSSILTSDNKTAFKRLFASFLGQSVGYNLQNVYFGNTSAVNINSVLTTYEFSSTLKTLASSPFTGINTSSFNLMPSQVTRVTKTTTGLTSAANDFVIVSNGASGANTEFVIFNGDNIGSKSNVSSGTASMQDLLEYPELELHTGSNIICPNAHLNQVHQIEKSKMNLKLYNYKDNN